MFRNAIAIAHQFTFPVILSRRQLNGLCGSGMGSFVVINDEGWIVTAAHILKELEQLVGSCTSVAARLAAEAAIRADQSIDEKKRRERIRALGKPVEPDAPVNCSAWWGKDGLTVTDIKILPEVDLGIARLVNFDPSMVGAFPLFKDPAKGIQQGVSLVKLGYPFHSITPDWDAATGQFSFPAAAMPPPSFPIEGILSRLLDVANPNGHNFPLLWIETSSPGLRGQSGGPTVDDQGAIWAIQSQTASLPLGFNPPAPGGKPGQVEHQFLNVGRGIHVGTILGFLDSHGVKYDMSAY